MMQLIYLEKLELQRNPLTLLPSSIADLTNLTHIDLGDSELNMLPADLIDMVILTLLNLENVDLKVSLSCVYMDKLMCLCMHALRNAIRTQVLQSAAISTNLIATPSPPIVLPSHER